MIYSAMASISRISLCFIYVIIVAAVVPVRAQLRPDYYEHSCPQALATIRKVVNRAVAQEPRMGASLLRLHFHDCFATGCDGSLLLDDGPGIVSEKTAAPNFKSARGFEVIDDIKSAVDSSCYGNVVSCADILAVAARDSVAALGGPSYQVLLGRRDARSANKNNANTNIPSPFMDFSNLLSNFENHGLNLRDLVVLSGGHTIGYAQCQFFRSRIYNETNIDPDFAAFVQRRCPPTGNDNTLAGLDRTSSLNFDANYFMGLAKKKGLLHSDQQLFKGDGSAGDDIVKQYARDTKAFWADFGAAMVKMGNIKVLRGTDGEIRSNCRKINS